MQKTGFPSAVFPFGPADIDPARCGKIVMQPYGHRVAIQQPARGSHNEARTGPRSHEATVASMNQHGTTWWLTGAHRAINERGVMTEEFKDISPIDWNRIEDQKDLDVWNKLTSQFWLPEKVALSNDLNSWGNMTDEEKTAAMRVFAGLTNLDTIQGVVGAVNILPFALTPHEESVMLNIGFMEAVHAKSYSYIFMTLSNTDDIDDVMRWTRENENMKRKREIILRNYDSGSPTRIRAASTLLESFLFYSGFYLPLYFAAKSKLTNTADIIRLIVRDEAVHGYYIGYKYQRELEKLTPEEQEAERDWVYDTLLELYDNEEEYAETIYDDIGLTEDVKEFMKYNANKALANLGYEELFPSPFPSPEVMTGLDISSENHDFFSGSGSSYVIGKTESTEDDDWDF